MRAKKNRAIEFYRFLFCCIILVLHSRDLGSFAGQNGGFNGGYLSVEFFFITSGFLIMKRAEKEPLQGSSAAKYALRSLIGRYKKLYPSYLFSLLLLAAAIKLCVPQFSLRMAVLKGFPDFLALQIFWEPFQINIHLWFLSALIWASFLVIFLVKRNRDLFCAVLEPLALLLYIGATYRRFGHLDLTEPDVVWISGIRAVVEIGLGCCLFVLYDHLKRTKIIPSAWVCTVLEIVLLCFILGVMYRTRRDYKDYVMMFAISAFVLVTFFERGLLTKLLDNPLSEFLGSVSYEMYLNQALVIMVTKAWFSPDNFWVGTGLRILILLAVSWLEKQLIGLLKTVRFEPVLRLLFEGNAGE